MCCDLDEFDTALREARRGRDPAAVLHAATTALAMWGEPLVEDTYSDWAQEFRERLRRERLEACELAAEAALALGNARAAAAAEAEAVAAEPLREHAVQLLARAHDAAGDRAAALDTIARFRGRLADELGPDPSSSLNELQTALLHGASDRVPAPAPDRAAGFAGLDFIGRDREVAALRLGVAERAVLLVPGPAGSGKSRLIAEALRGSPVPVVAARAFPSERAEGNGRSPAACSARRWLST